MSNNYQRLFYILKNMDSDVSNPTGYIKVEINCEVAKLQIALSNLLNRQGLTYQLYGIKKDDKQLIYTVICDIPNENGRADIKISTDIHSIGSNKLRLEDINIFAIITQLPNRTPSIKCPLVAYTRGEVLWKREFEALLLNKELLTSNDNIATTVTMNKIKSDIVSQGTTENIEIGNAKTISTFGKVDNFKKDKTEETSNIHDEIDFLKDTNGKIKVSVDVGNGETKVSQDNETDVLEAVENAETVTSQDAENMEYSGAEILEDIDDLEIEAIDNIENVETKVSKALQTDNVKMLEWQDNLEQAFNIQEGMPPQNGVEPYSDKKYSLAEKFESAVTSIYNTHISSELGKEKMSELVSSDNDILSSVQKNFKDKSSIEINENKIKTELNMPSLKEELDKNFESYNPFKMKSKNFKWWKINSPGYLNNILFRNNIKTYLLFNPKVMLAHYKYRYIIFGIRNDKHSGKEYFICGVPGVYSIDEPPFGNMGSWAQIEGYKPKYGAFGYWVILIDPRTGKLIKVK